MVACVKWSTFVFYYEMKTVFYANVTHEAYNWVTSATLAYMESEMFPSAVPYCFYKMEYPLSFSPSLFVGCKKEESLFLYCYG